MAESILYNVVANIVSKLSSTAVKELGLLWGVKDEVHKLQDSLTAMKAGLHDAEERQSKEEAVKDWVSKLKDVVYEIEDLMDECAYDALEAHVLAKDQRKRKQVRMLFSKLIKRPYSNLKLAHKIKDIRLRLKAVNEDKTQFNFSEIVLHTSSLYDNQFKRRRETYSFKLEEEVVGRSDDKDKIIELLLNTKHDFAIISIVGMGGLGKTTLAQFAYNDDKITKHFELKLWVCVSENFDVKIIVENIIESATKKKPQSSLQIDSLQNELRKQIDGKKYLLVMDDVWNDDYDKWDSLKGLLMGGAKGSRILITTRDEKVARVHDTTFLHLLQILDECNAWLLFKKMVFLEGQGEEFENSNLIEIGKEIVTKLKGVPLAIRTIGRLLKEKKSQHFWLFFKDKELYQAIEQEKNKNLNYMLSILELSYKHLSANLKQCFLYCALFSKDYKIPKDELILLWRAQGFIPPNDKDELIDIGEDYFLELLSKSFFQEVTKDGSGNIKTCKMHDLMHDLACSITKNDFIYGLNNNMDKLKNNIDNHFSLISISLEEFKELLKTLSKARSLRTFVVQDPYWSVNKFFPNNSRLRTLIVDFDPREKGLWSIIGRFKHLRYLSIWYLDLKYLPNCFTKLYNLESLSLRWNQLEELPCDIKNLINLKYLDLSFNRCLKFLPNSITELCKLEKLILLRGAYLQELPRDIKKLVNLKHLDILHCDFLSHMPKGLGELTNLQTLRVFVLGKNNGAGLNELKGLNKLNGCLMIKNLQFVSDVDLQMKAMILQPKTNLRKLYFKWENYSDEPAIDVYERVLDCLEPHTNIEGITIVGYGGVKLCNWLSSGSLGRLVKIRVANCERLEHLPPFDKFSCLKKLYLEDLPSIEYIIVNDDSISSSTFFPLLEKLRILGMPKLKRWWKSSTASTESNKPNGDSFPCLFDLEISGCTLHILMSFHTPSLKHLSIRDLEERPIEEDEFDVVPLQNFENLSSLSLSNFSKLEYLPKCLQHVTTLQCLSLWGCDILKSLPEWIHNLTSLTKLKIHYCEKLTSMPEGIRHIHGLRSLEIGDCPILEERCKKDTGDDWPKIAHIPELIISYRRH